MVLAWVAAVRKVTGSNMAELLKTPFGNPGDKHFEEFKKFREERDDPRDKAKPPPYVPPVPMPNPQERKRRQLIMAKLLTEE